MGNKRSGVTRHRLIAGGRYDGLVEQLGGRAARQWALR